MKKTLVLIGILTLVLGLFSALAESETPNLTRSGYTVAENGIVRDASGQIVGATEEYDAWVERQHAQGLSTNAVAYRPLTIQNGEVYDAQSGAQIGTTAAYVGQLGDSSPSTFLLFACAAAFLTLCAVCRKRRMAAQ